MDWRIPPRAPASLQKEADVLQNWAIDRGATTKQCNRIVGLLSVEWMCRLPLPPRTHRSKGVTNTHWHRFLFRRHIQHILGWKHRLSEGDPAGFSTEVNLLIRTKFYPEPNPDHHGETSGGGQDGSAPESCTITNKLTVCVQHDRGAVGQQVAMAGGYVGRAARVDASAATLGPCDGGTSASCKPGRILPPWCTRQGQKRESDSTPKGSRMQISEADIGPARKRGRCAPGSDGQ